MSVASEDPIASDDRAQNDAVLVALLFEAGQKEAVSTDVVMDVLQEALKTGRRVDEIVRDNDILSRRQRESVQRFVGEQSQYSVARRNTVGNGEQFSTPVHAAKREAILPADHDTITAQFRSDHDAALPSGAKRYDAKEEIGRGGWGVVERAHDRQLDRDVAVKKLGPRASAEADIAQRFLHEARITGQLQHPGIVPVYERGVSLDDRQPFYAMKLLDGITLRDVIRAYHEKPKGREKRKAFHELLNRFVDVCQAIAYAHDRQIIHRDLKPSNVVVGGFGETVVVDWGLAKEIGKPNPIETEETVRAGTPMPSKANAASGQLDGLLDPVMTQAGSVIGTPAFMSPEQARGANATLDTRTDTYALGVILYVMLTGKPPFHGEDVQTTLKQVLEGDYQHPKLIDRNIPGPLASICTKAMSLERDDRYQTASEVADDVAHFLANEPVSAHHDSWVERASRWCRRHPTIATTTIAGAIILATTSTIATVFVSEAHQAERVAKKAAVVAHAGEVEARETAEIAKDLALERLEESRRAADAWLVELSGTLQRYPGMTSVRRDLIEQAKSHYLDLYNSACGNPDMQLEAARCLIRLGDLHLMQGDADRIEKARQSFADGTQTLAGIGDDGTPEVIAREKLNANIGLLMCAIDAGEFKPEDANELNRAIRELQTLDASHHSDELRSSIARAFLVVGRGCESIADNKGAVAAYESSLDWVHLLNDAASSSHQHLMSTVREDLSRAYAAIGQHSKAARTLQDHIDAESARVDANSDRPDLLESRAIARMLWAGEQRFLGDDWAAENAYREAVEDLSDSWQLMFGDHFYSENLAVAQANLGQLAIRLNRLEDAEKMLRDAVQQLTGLMQSAHADRETASRMAACNVSLAHVLQLRGNPAAEETIKRSIDIFEYLKNNSSLNTGDQLAHGRAMANLGRLHRGQGNATSAIIWLAKAVDHFECIGTDKPGPRLQQSTAAAQIDLASAMHADGRLSESRQCHLAAIRTLSELSGAESPDEQLRKESATVDLIRCLLESPGTLRNVERADRLLREIDVTSSAGGHIHQLVAISRYRAGDYAAAKQAIERAQAARRFPVATDTAILGCIQLKTDDTDAAVLALKRARAGLALSPGDQRMSRWTAELEQAIQALQSESRPTAK